MTTRTPAMQAGANGAPRLRMALWGLMALVSMSAVVVFLLGDPWARLLGGLGLMFLGVSLLMDSRHYHATRYPVLRWTFITMGLVTLLSGLATMLHDIGR